VVVRTVKKRLRTRNEEGPSEKEPSHQQGGKTPQHTPSSSPLKRGGNIELGGGAKGTGKSARENFVIGRNRSSEERIEGKVRKSRETFAGSCTIIARIQEREMDRGSHKQRPSLRARKEYSKNEGRSEPQQTEH